MANPQKENGFIQIANEIVDALCKCHPGGSEGQVLWAIIRKTYGWKKLADKISYDNLMKITGLSRRSVVYAIKNLEYKNMIVVQRSKTGLLNDVNLISLQKDYDKWVLQEIDGSARKCPSYKATIQKQKYNYKLRGSARNGSSARNGQKVVQEIDNNLPFLAPTKETIKEKQKKSVFSYSSDFETFWKNYPKKSGSKKTAYDNWNKLNGDKPEIETILKAIQTQKDWRHNARDGDFRPEWKDPERWIKGRMWEAEVGAAPERKEAWEL